MRCGAGGSSAVGSATLLFPSFTVSWPQGLWTVLFPLWSSARAQGRVFQLSSMGCWNSVVQDRSEPTIPRLLKQCTNLITIPPDWPPELPFKHTHT